MYFVVYVVGSNTLVIVPSSWIQDIDEHLEKFINRSLNTAQRFVCFYTNDENAFESNGAPNMDYPANFNMPYRNDFDGPGCFIVRLKRFTGWFWLIKSNHTLWKWIFDSICFLSAVFMP